MSITTTHKIFQSQTGHKAEDTLEYAIGTNNLPGSTFGVGEQDYVGNTIRHVIRSQILYPAELRVRLYG
jgi:hypothetical protein